MTNRTWRLSVGLVFVSLLLVPSVPAQQSSTDDLRKEIQALSESVKAMQKDLQEIKAMLANRAPAPPPEIVALDLANAHSRGDSSARLLLIEFSDYQWPFCARHVRETAPQIDKEYVETGKVKHVFLDFPLESIHKLAFKAAEAAGCAGEQGKYWEMHDRLYANQKDLEQWNAHAQAIGLDVPKFEECLNSGRQAASIRRDMAQGQKASVTGTPAFFLAYADPKSSQIKTVVRLTGAQPFANFKTAIDKLLAPPPPAAGK
jgi:protein-disulfide isomerase